MQQELICFAAVDQKRPRMVELGKADVGYSTRLLHPLAIPDEHPIVFD